MKSLIILFIFSLNTFAAITLEELNETFLPANEYGPVKLDKLQKLEELYHETGFQHVLDETLDKLNFNQLSDLSMVMKTCKAKHSTNLGYYQPGEQRKHIRGRNYLNEIFGITWDEKILKKIEDSYIHYIKNSSGYFSLVLVDYPEICLKDGESLASSALTFVHESVHFRYHDETEEIDMMDYSDAEDYAWKKLYKPEGELAAFKAEGEFLTNITSLYGYQEYNWLRGRIVDGDYFYSEKRFTNFIMKVLNYEERFIKQYKDFFHINYNVNTKNRDNEKFYLKQFISNLAINEQNLINNLKNRDYYQDSIDIYARTDEEIAAAEENLQQSLDKIDEAKNSIEHYKKLIEEIEQSVAVQDSKILEMRTCFPHMFKEEAGDE